MVSTEPLQPQPITLTLTYRSSSEGRSQDLTRFPIAIRLLFLFIFNPDKYSVSLLPYSCQNVYPQNQNFKPLIQQNPIRTRGDTGTKQEIDRKQGSSQNIIRHVSIGIEHGVPVKYYFCSFFTRKRTRKDCRCKF